MLVVWIAGTVCVFRSQCFQWESCFSWERIDYFVRTKVFWLRMCEKRNQDTAIALGLIILQSQRVQFPSREIKTVSDAFCGALTTVLDHYKEIKHFTEERGYILHCTFNHSCDALLLFCFGPTAHCASIADGIVPRCPSPRRKIVLLRRKPASSGPRNAELRVKTTSTVFCEGSEKVAINLLRKQLCKTSLFISFIKIENIFYGLNVLHLKGFFSPLSNYCVNWVFREERWQTSKTKAAASELLL